MQQNNDFYLVLKNLVKANANLDLRAQRNHLLSLGHVSPLLAEGLLSQVRQSVQVLNQVKQTIKRQKRRIKESSPRSQKSLEMSIISIETSNIDNIDEIGILSTEENIQSAQKELKNLRLQFNEKQDEVQKLIVLEKALDQKLRRSGEELQTLKKKIESSKQTKFSILKYFKR